MEDKLGNQISPHKWYEAIQTDTNPYSYARHIMLTDKKNKKGKHIVLELWTNSNHEGWVPTTTTLPEAFFQGETFRPSKDEIKEEYKRLQPLFVKKIFDPWAR